MFTKRILVLSDFHAHPQKNDAMEYGHDASYRFIQSFLEEVAEKQKDIDLILLNGDFVRHKLAQRDPELPDNFDQQKDIIQDVRQMVQSAFPGIPIHFSIGNNDLPYHNQVPSKAQKEAYYGAFWDIMTENQPHFKKSSREQFLLAGNYFHRDKFHCYLSINTNQFGMENQTDLENSQSSLQQVEDLLSTPLCKFTIFYHIPNGVHFYRQVEQQLVPELDEKLIKIFQKHHKKIQQIISAHYHFSDIRVIQVDEKNSIPHINVPSISLYNYNNPGYTLIDDSSINFYSKQLQSNGSFLRQNYPKNGDFILSYRAFLWTQKDLFNRYQANRKGVDMPMEEVEQLFGTQWPKEQGCEGDCLSWRDYITCMDTKDYLVQANYNLSDEEQ